jgi:hypothetical protein
MAAKRTKPRASGFQAVALAFAGKRDVTLRPGWGEGNLVLERAKKIFAMEVRGDLVVKIAKARVDELVAAKQGTRFDPRKNGRVMKEWLVVRGTTGWVELATEAYAFSAKASKK